MSTGDQRTTWAADNLVLAAIGARLHHQETRITVRLPLDMAHAALRAWERDDEPDGDSTDVSEAVEERMSRHRAGSLALIGLAIESRGEYHDDHVEVEVDAWLIGHALDAADDGGLI